MVPTTSVITKARKKLLKELSYYTGRYTIAPEFLSLLITLRCNFRCASCSIWKNPAPPELDQTEWHQLLTRLTTTLPPTTFVEINGGEPLLRKDLVCFLIREAKKHFHTVALNSNGLLITPEIIAELEQAKLDTLKISFYSLNPEIHNRIRGHIGAFEHAERAIDIITKSSLHLEVGILLTAATLDGAPDLINHLTRLPHTTVILQPLDEEIESNDSKNLDDNHLITDLWPTHDQTQRFFSWMLKHPEKVKNSEANLHAIKRYYLQPDDILSFRCFTGQRNLVVYPDGSVALCFKRKPIGTLKTQSLETLLTQATQERAAIRTCPKYCRIVGCNFSRGLKEFLKNTKD